MLTLMFKPSLYLFSMFLIFGPAFVWEHFDFFSTYITSNDSGGIGGEIIRISGPFLSVLSGLGLLMILLPSEKQPREVRVDKTPS